MSHTARTSLEVKARAHPARCRLDALVTQRAGCRLNSHVERPGRPGAPLARKLSMLPVCLFRKGFAFAAS